MNRKLPVCQFLIDKGADILKKNKVSYFNDNILTVFIFCIAPLLCSFVM